MKNTRRLAAITAAALTVGTLGACSSDDHDDKQDTLDTTSAPTNATWSGYAGIQVPTSEEQGPLNDDPVLHGYEHSPQGAVLAAMNTQAQMALAGDDKYADVSTYTLAPGKGRDQWVQGRTLATVDGEVDPEQAPTFQGFRVDNYSDESAVVVLATDYPESGLLAYPVQVNWINDDWRVVPAPQEAGVTPAQIDSMDGFTEFSAGKEDE